VTTLWTGLSTGALYTLVALTYNITLTATGIFNFAQAQMVMAGGFVAYIGSANGWPVPLTLVAALALGAALGATEERIAIRPLRNQSGLGYLVTTLGVGVALDGLAYVIYGTTPRNVNFFLGQKAFSLFGGRLEPIDLSMFVTALLATAILYLISERTRWGLAARATTSDKDAASIRGVNVARVSFVSFVVAGALGAAAGLLAAPAVTASYTLGDNLVVYGFMVLAFGGFGSYGGALIAGLAVGIIEAEAERWLPAGASPVVLFGVLLVALLIRPTGLFGRRGLRTI
jgi:branched-chain amino acid transport system permease protein